MKLHRYFLVAVIAIALAFSASALLTPDAHASASTPQRHSSNCAVQMVYLHGTNPPTVQCLRQKIAPGLAPDIATTQCSNRALALRASTQGAGDEYICFIGTGFVNLTDFYRAWPYTWNDSANWYGPGCNYGVFYIDINGNGTHQNFVAGTAHNFDGQNGRLPAYTLSSLRIDTSC